MKPTQALPVVCVVAGAIGLGIGSGSLPAAPTCIALASALLFTVRPNSIVPASLILLCAARPAFVPATVAGLLPYEPVLLLAAVQVALLWPPYRRAVAQVVVYLVGLVLAVVVGVISSLDNDKILSDLRYPLALGLAFFIVAGFARHGRVAQLLPVVKWTLIWSAGLVSFAAATGAKIGGRIETAELIGFAQTTSANRYITNATPLALAAICVGLVLIVEGELRFREVAPYMGASMLLTFLSFSRNSLVALLVTLVVAVCASRTARHRIRFMTSAIVKLALALVVVVVISASGLLTGTGVGEYIDAYSGRVLGGLSAESRAVDPSALYRESETGPLLDAIQSSPLIGHGFGYPYKPAFGDPSGFAATTGRYYAHNFYYWLLAKAGITGLMCFVWFVLGSIRRMRSVSFGVAIGSASVGVLAVAVVAPAPIGVGAGVLGGLLGYLGGARPELSTPIAEVHATSDFGAFLP